MRVAVVIDRFDAVRGGAERSTGEFVRVLARMGHEVEVWTRSAAQSAAAAHVRTIPSAGPSRAAKLANFLRGVRRRIAEEGRPDILHAMIPLPEADLYMPRAGLIASVVRAKLEAEPTWPRKLARRFSAAFNRKERMLLALERELMVAERGPACVAISDLVAEDARTTYHVPPSRLHVIFNGVDVSALDAAAAGVTREGARAVLGLDDATVVFACVTHDFRRKGVRELIAATRRLRERSAGTPAVVLVAGRGPLEKYGVLAGAAAEDGTIRFLGPVEPAVRVYRAADVLVLPTWFDPCSRAVLEALALGIPAITTARNGAAEILADGRAGLVVSRPDDADALAGAMEAFLDGARRRAAAEAALALRDRISIERHVREVVALYASLRQGRGAAAASEAGGS